MWLCSVCKGYFYQENNLQQDWNHRYNCLKTQDLQTDECTINAVLPDDGAIAPKHVGVFYRLTSEVYVHLVGWTQLQLTL